MQIYNNLQQQNRPLGIEPLYPAIPWCWVPCLTLTFLRPLLNSISFHYTACSVHRHNGWMDHAKLQRLASVTGAYSKTTLPKYELGVSS